MLRFTDMILHPHRTLSLTHIPAKAYEYRVNGKSAIEWVVERYSVTTDKASGIVTVSLETVDIVRSLPPLQELN